MTGLFDRSFENRSPRFVEYGGSDIGSTEIYTNDESI
jgi:hypothetical protein